MPNWPFTQHRTLRIILEMWEFVFTIMSWLQFLAIVFQYVEQPIPEKNESLPQFWWGAQQM